MRIFDREIIYYISSIAMHCSDFASSTVFIICYGWWFQPIWKICSSNWIIPPGRGEHKKIFELPPPSNTQYLTHPSESQKTWWTKHKYHKSKNATFSNIFFVAFLEHQQKYSVFKKVAQKCTKHRIPRKKRQDCQSSKGFAANIKVSKSSGIFRGSLRFSSWWLNYPFEKY